jgi:sortase A
VTARRLVLALCAGVALWQFAGAGWIHAKARLAQWLIADAWATSSSRGGAPVRPWPWADTWPEARLRIAELGIEQYVLHGASGEALAFGPGRDLASALPGGAGPTILAGHRDTHFAFLATLPQGARIHLELVDGSAFAYRAAARYVVDSRAGRLPPELPSGALLLITCFPFEAVAAGGPLRYVVVAEPVTAFPTPALRLSRFR